MCVYACVFCEKLFRKSSCVAACCATGSSVTLQSVSSPNLPIHQQNCVFTFFYLCQGWREAKGFLLYLFFPFPLHMVMPELPNYRSKVPRPLWLFWLIVRLGLNASFSLSCEILRILWGVQFSSQSENSLCWL